MLTFLWSHGSYALSGVGDLFSDAPSIDQQSKCYATFLVYFYITLCSLGSESLRKYIQHGCFMWQYSACDGIILLHDLAVLLEILHL